MTSIRDAAPFAYVVFCSTALVLQSIWELFLVPLMYSRWTRPFVLLQGLGFFAMSLVLLNLQYLPLVELVLWALLFGPAGIAWLRARFPSLLAPRMLATPEADPERISFGSRLLPALLVVVLFLAVVQNAISPYLLPESLARYTARWHSRAQVVFFPFAQQPVNVFNKLDLGMGAAFFVLHEVDEEGRHIRTVPIYDDEGGRLDYLRNDLLYFGYSLHWQRRKMEVKFVDGDPNRPAPATLDLVGRVALLDSVLTGGDRERLYEVRFYTREMLDDVVPVRWSEAREGKRMRFKMRAEALAGAGPRDWMTFDLPPGQWIEERRVRETDVALTSGS
jgi:hypothetical protein